MSSSLHHTAVLATETIDFVRPTDLHLFDGTFGHAGHSILALQKATNATLDATDRDMDTAQLWVDKLIALWLISRVTLHHRSYAEILQIAQEAWVKYDYVLIDIGVNMQHFADGDRGFSIKRDGPLDMRFDQTQKQSAYDIINSYRTQQLVDLLLTYGDYREPRARIIADTIHNHRKHTPITTTFQLVAALEDCGCGIKDQAIIFQCLRIETNRELEELESFLAVAPQACAAAGRIAVITFHSIEDRMVKLAMKQREQLWLGMILTKHTIKPSFQEIKRNPPSRSAKLRVFECKTS